MELLKKLSRRNSKLDNIKAVGVIPARYDSTRFPGKPLAKLLDKPMIQWTYENVCKATRLNKVYVATDDQRIADMVQAFGGNVIITNYCANGSERCLEALQQLEEKEFHSYQIVVNIQGDEPLVNPKHIDSLIEILCSSPQANMAATAAPINNHGWPMNKDEINTLNCITTTKVVMNNQEEALYFSRAVIPHTKSGQPDISGETIYYKNCGMYAFRRNFLEVYALALTHPLQTVEDLEQLKALEMGETIKMVVVEHAEGGIDLPEQLTVLNERLAKEGGYNYVNYIAK